MELLPHLLVLMDMELKSYSHQRGWVATKRLYFGKEEGPPRKCRSLVGILKATQSLGDSELRPRALSSGGYNYKAIRVPEPDFIARFRFHSQGDRYCDTRRSVLATQIF